MRSCSAPVSSTAPLTRTTGRVAVAVDASPSAPAVAAAGSASASGVRRSRTLRVTVVPALLLEDDAVDELPHDQQPAAAVAGVAVRRPPGALVADGHGQHAVDVDVPPRTDIGPGSVPR